ncbi:hypothetical protein [Mucilaginibacter xinganensis]|uniref:Uncharacterized protein n=1 Tax=Mucilaginibacter xinganensis TaxID=1234841 RepID=A0A223NT03_9SPHI|nr:hypothetical protein [Mucilaginibacter xinganensis]ASU32983.1 hypothetical protein MuYL_1083 [Mucilaginibacter xinganensis]
MKYAFIIGTSAFIVPGKTISYGSDGNWNHFLRINAIYHDTSAPAENSFFDVDIDIKDIDGTPVTIISNKAVTGAPYTIKVERDTIRVLRIDGTTLIEVHQLDDESAMSLEHNITAELDVQAPVVVIRVRGEFLVDGMHIRAENEKLLINDIGYATAALVGHNDLKFTPAGVVL